MVTLSLKTASNFSKYKAKGHRRKFVAPKEDHVACLIPLTCY